MADVEPTDRDRTGDDHDVAIVGGGPAGCSAGVFLAREGLDTAIFDRGRSSITRCAHLENYLGFPAGIDVETLYGLMHDHAGRAGCAIVPDHVESVDRTGDGGFVVVSGDGDPVTARRVVAATRYDGEYLRGLDDEGTMFEADERDGEEHESFDRDYADRDGRTPVEGLYVASPSDEADAQAMIAAARGARVARRVVADARIDRGWWEQAARDVDWVRREAELDERWADREAWIEWFDDYHADEAPVDPDSGRFRRVREAYIDDRRSSYIGPEEIETRAERGHEALAAHLDADAVVAATDVEALLDALDEETVLDAMDDDAIREYADAGGRSPEVSE